MWMWWLASIVFAWCCPSTLAYCNPFLAPLARAILLRNTSVVIFGAYLTGLLNDLVLSSPKLGVLALSSLLSVSIVQKIASFFTIERWQILILVALMSGTLTILDPLLCCLMSSYEFRTLFSLYRCGIFVGASLLWAIFLLAGSESLTWWNQRKYRRSE